MRYHPQLFYRTHFVSAHLLCIAAGAASKGPRESGRLSAARSMRKKEKALKHVESLAVLAARAKHVSQHSLSIIHTMRCKVAEHFAAKKS